MIRVVITQNLLQVQKFVQAIVINAKNNNDIYPLLFLSQICYLWEKHLQLIIEYLG